jgi:hypothetical protein
MAKTQHTNPFLFGTEDPLEPFEEIRVHNVQEPVMKETSPGVLGPTPLKNVFGPNKDQVQGTQEAQTNAASQHRTSTLPEGTSKQSKSSLLLSKQELTSAQKKGGDLREWKKLARKGNQSLVVSSTLRLLLEKRSHLEEEQIAQAQNKRERRHVPEPEADSDSMAAAAGLPRRHQ